MTVKTLFLIFQKKDMGLKEMQLKRILNSEKGDKSKKRKDSLNEILDFMCTHSIKLSPFD